MFRLYTEDVNRPLIMAIVRDHVSGATFFYGDGLWEGRTEKACVIETTGSRENVMMIAHELCVLNNQVSVLVSETVTTDEDIRFMVHAWHEPNKCSSSCNYIGSVDTDCEHCFYSRAHTIGQHEKSVRELW